MTTAASRDRSGPGGGRMPASPWPCRRHSACHSPRTIWSVSAGENTKELM